MAYYLVAISGPNKGQLWEVSEKGLLIGRSSVCDVVTMDSMVSRRQCRVFFHENNLYVEDVGGRNPILVNGAALSSALLKPTDVLSVGRSAFMVASNKTPTSTLSEDVLDSTYSWASGLPAPINVEEALQRIDLRPSTLSDLVFLYDLNRQLCRQATLEDLLHVLYKHIHNRLAPQVCRVVIEDEKGNLGYCGSVNASPSEKDKSLMEVAKQCLEVGQGILLLGNGDRYGKKERIFTMAAPLSSGVGCNGALVVETHTPFGAFDEDDLKLLVLIAGSAAPIMCALKHRICPPNE